MRSLIAFAVVAVVISQCVAYRIRRGIISGHHESGGGESHGHGATSYQNVHIENFHPVPVYIKHGHGEESKHRIGSVQHNVKVSHGHGKHDYGHAIITGNIEGHGHDGGHGYESIAVGGGGGDYSAASLEKAGYEGGYDGNNLEHANLESHHQSVEPNYEQQYAFEQHGASDGGAQQHGYESYEGGEADAHADFGGEHEGHHS